MKVSIIIPSRNRGELVKNTVKSILQNETDNEFELYLVDQSTNELTKKAVENFIPDKRFHYIHSSTTGSGRARNVALVEVTGDIVLFTDDDCIVPQNWIQVMASLFENKNVGMAFCNVIPGAYDESAGFIPTYIREEDFIAKHVGHKNQARGIGAGMAVRRETALKLGGFDEFLPASMDGDLAVRMLLKGNWVYETSKVSVIHDGFRTWEQGKSLAKRNYTGIGIAYSKPIKCGFWSFIPVVTYEGIFLPLSGLLKSVFNLKKPYGLRNLFYFWTSFFRGLTLAVEKNQIVFKPNEH